MPSNFFISKCNQANIIIRLRYPRYINQKIIHFPILMYAILMLEAGLTQSNTYRTNNIQYTPVHVIVEKHETSIQDDDDISSIMTS